MKGSQTILCLGFLMLSIIIVHILLNLLYLQNDPSYYPIKVGTI